jgi:hypothetical protein
MDTRTGRIIAKLTPNPSPYTIDEKSSDWMNLTKPAKFLGISSTALRQAAQRGEIQAEHPLREGPWLFSRATLERGPLFIVARDETQITCMGSTNSCNVDFSTIPPSPAAQAAGIFLLGITSRATAGSPTHGLALDSGNDNFAGSDVQRRRPAERRF